MDDKPLAHQFALNNIVAKCASYTFRHLLEFEPGVTEYDVIHKDLKEDGSWRVVLTTPRMPGRMFDFSHRSGNTPVNVSTYIKAHSFFTEP